MPSFLVSSHLGRRIDHSEEGTWTNGGDHSGPVCHWRATEEAKKRKYHAFSARNYFAADCAIRRIKGFLSPWCKVFEGFSERRLIPTLADRPAFKCSCETFQLRDLIASNVGLSG